MTKSNIETNAFAEIIADDKLAWAEKGATLAKALKDPKRQEEFEAFTDHLQCRYVQTAADIVALVGLEDFSLASAFQSFSSEVRATASSKASARFRRNGKAIEDMLSGTNDMLETCTLLQIASLIAGMQDTSDKMDGLVKDMKAQRALLLKRQEGNNALIAVVGRSGEYGPASVCKASATNRLTVNSKEYVL